MRKPRGWGYSRKVALIWAPSVSASTATAFVLSGINTRNAPPKNSQAAQHASTAVLVVSLKAGRRSDAEIARR